MIWLPHFLRRAKPVDAITPTRPPSRGEVWQLEIGVETVRAKISGVDGGFVYYRINSFNVVWRMQTTKFISIYLPPH